MLTINNRDDLFAALEQGATVITPNNRLSNQLLDAFFKQSDHSVKVKPRCLPYPSFLRDLFKKARHLYAHVAHPISLSPQQQRHLWRQTLGSQEGQCNDGLLSEVQSAWTRCQQWEIDSHCPSFTQTPQTRQFQQWMHQFERQLKQLGAVTADQLSTYLLTLPELMTANSRMIWACFDDFTPQQCTLQQAMMEHGSEQYTYDLAANPTPLHQYIADDTDDECLQMIQWIKTKRHLGETRIAVVVPDLQAQSSHLQRLIQRHIPASQFSISLGQPLIDHPLVAHALHWLKLDKITLSECRARLLLNSPFLAGAKTEFIARASTAEDNKLIKEPTLSFEGFTQLLKRTAPKLAEALHELPDYPQNASISEWIEHFKNRLIHLGFPGEYPLDSVSYQYFQRFTALFDELLQLSVISPMMNNSDVLETLCDLAKSTIFQPEKSTTPIQILGLLEASGCLFDSVWVSGLTDQCLPQKTHLSAFIPLDVQRDCLMPHALPLRELAFAEQWLKRLQHGSHDTVFSYPRLTGDSPNLPSPLIAHLPILVRPAALCTTSMNRLIHQDESYSLPLTPGEIISGGTTLLANQAKCPFRAFAAHRLTAKPAHTLSEGPDASERGQIMHKIMDLLWTDLKDQAQLLALAPDELNQRVEDAIIHALTPLIKENRHSFSPLIQEVELSRLKRLVNACLQWEKQRPPFVVEAIEQDFNIQLAGIDFRVRVDRLDHIGANKKWVIDYKSSLPINKPWNEERPEAPQLLLYALLDQRINALLFVQLKAGRVTCSGLSEEPELVQGMSALKKDERWADRQSQWHQQLTHLAHEFNTGHCPPQPFRESSCQRCDFPHLCRVGQS